MPGNENSGRKAKKVVIAGIQQSLDATASEATMILDNFIHRRRGFKSIKQTLLQQCNYVIDHAIGKARQKIEHSGGILTYADLSKSATELDKKPRAILADTEELSAKTPSKN